MRVLKHIGRGAVAAGVLLAVLTAVPTYAQIVPSGGGGGGGGGGGAVTAASGSYAAGFSTDVGNCVTATAWTGTGTPSLCSLELGTYNATIAPLSSQPIAQNRIGAVEQYTASGPFTVTSVPTASSSNAVSHSAVTALGTSLVVKASAGNVYGFYCNSVSGGAAGHCVVVNAASVPATGAITGVLDQCDFLAGSTGCSLSRPYPVNYSTGIVVLLTSATTPFTYTTGTDTAFISADYE